MNPRNVHIPQDSQGHQMNDSDSAFESLDFEKIRQVFVSSWPWVLAIMLIVMSLVFLYLRYTKPIYSAESTLKLDIKNDANLLGLQNPLEQDIKGLAGEIEILRSRLFFSQVADVINMDISYFHPGRSHLVDERYGNSPFEVTYELQNQSLLDKAFNIEILNDNEFYLSCTYLGGRIGGKHQFGTSITSTGFTFIINKTSYFDDQKDLIDFYFVINSKSAVIDFLESHVTVEPVNFNANTIKISLSDFNQVKARNLLQAIDTIYLAFSKNAKNQAVEQKIKFLETQMAKTSKELVEYEDYFEKFTIKNRTTDLSSDLTKTIALLNALDSQRYKMRDHLVEVDLVNENFRNDDPVSVFKMPESIASMVNDYNLLVNERDLKLNSYNENTQVIKRLDQQIEIAKRSASSRLLSYKTNLIQDLEEVNKKRALLEENFIELPSMGTSYNKNRRLYTLQEEFYFSLIQSKIELEIARAGTVTNFVILSPAAVASTPIHPKKLMIYALGLVVGLLLSAFFLAIQFLLHDKITSQKELEKILHAPILGLIPNYKQEKLDHSKLIVTNNPKSAISESLRSIRTNMEFMATNGQNQLISVTSTVSGEGKTFIAVNLGGVFAYAGQKVVIVDLDMRKPKVHLAFESNDLQKGMSTILIGKNKIEECIKESELENLHFISAGPMPPNPSELLLSPKFDEFLENLKKTYDVIFLDSPPVGLVTDGILVMKKADLPIYVVRADYSKRSYLKSVHNLISNNKFDHLSVILNGVNTSKGSYGYGYGYGYYEE
ncbi:polysaccharide biosynthesis tyrosine autokinase [Reichenbachiella carrageenanivorans]|uniref:non-specific protein-tyrosine kinase n=1 Tax=Reichenbachiella carrageenanivorans TaxID=2979869 RepID=A0ABY6D527_9BACT|nr:tyrosine-protein kinase [Reichenbachiella carrageenanivorans]UXX80223.1 polysaccharide biosynthesis tyrosine autokinase [Reichenbachiella carrageenanivorans]